MRTIFFVLSTLSIAYCLFFVAALNPVAVEIHWGFGQWSLNIITWLAIALLTGFVLGILTLWPEWWRFFRYYQCHRYCRMFACCDAERFSKPLPAKST